MLADTQTLMGLALTERGQCKVPRVETSLFPPVVLSKSGTYDADGNATIEVTADRDYLFYNLSIDTTGGASGVNRLVKFDAEYCDTRLIRSGDWRVWQTCCDSKPFFVHGMRDTKTLTFTFSGGTPDDDVVVTLAGIQGNGCDC